MKSRTRRRIRQRGSPSRQVRVLAVVDSDKALVEASLKLLDPESREPCRPSKRLQATVPDGLVLDALPVVVPLGTGRMSPDAIDIRSLHPTQSQRFLVAGAITLHEGEPIPEKIGKTPIFVDPPVRAYKTSGTSRAVGTAPDVVKKLDMATLYRHGLTGSGVAIAIMDTGIYLPHLEKNLGRDFNIVPKVDRHHSWAPDTVTTVPFMHRRGHGTMCAYDALAIAPEASLLDFAALIGRVDHSAQETLRWIIAAYSYILFHWKTNPDPAKRMTYKSLVISNSWGVYHPSLDAPPGSTKRFIDNPDHPFRQLVWLLSQVGADIVFSSGNCGDECPAAACLQETVGTINGGAAYPEVLTVGGCTVEDEIVGYSSLGPAIPPFPKEKPDVVTYTHFDGSEAAGRKQPDTGTSAACPVAAGVIAAIRTKAPSAGASPALVQQTLRNTARKLGPANWAPDYGHGVLQPVAAARALGLVP